MSDEKLDEIGVQKCPMCGLKRPLLNPITLCHCKRVDVELKPCPFCGDMPTIGVTPSGDTEISCPNWDEDEAKDKWCAGSPMIGLTNRKRVFDNWNGAFCWKEIDRLTEIIGKKDEALRLAPCTCHPATDFECERCKALKLGGGS